MNVDEREQIKNDVMRVLGALQSVEPAARMTVLTMAIIGEGSRLGMPPEHLAVTLLRMLVEQIGSYEPETRQ